MPSPCQSLHIRTNYSHYTFGRKSSNNIPNSFFICNVLSTYSVWFCSFIQPTADCPGFSAGSCERPLASSSTSFRTRDVSRLITCPYNVSARDGLATLQPQLPFIWHRNREHWHLFEKLTSWPDSRQNIVSIFYNVPLLYTLKRRVHKPPPLPTQPDVLQTAPVWVFFCCHFSFPLQDLFVCNICSSRFGFPHKQSCKRHRICKVFIVIIYKKECFVLKADIDFSPTPP